MRQAYFDATPEILLSFMTLISNIPNDAKILGVEVISNPFWEQVGDKKLIQNIRFYFSSKNREVPGRCEGNQHSRFEVEGTYEAMEKVKKALGKRANKKEEK